MSRRSKGKTYQAFVKYQASVKGNPHLEKKLILRFDPESKQLVPIQGIPMDKSLNFDGLVLFLCLDESFYSPKKKLKLEKGYL